MTVTIPLEPAERTRFEAMWNAAPGMLHMGARADFSDPGAVRVTIQPLQPVHRGGLGTDAVNGAVITGLCDVALGMVGHFHTMGRRAGTAQLNIQFLRPVLGDGVRAVGRLVRAGTNLVFATVEVEDMNGRVCARCDGIVAVSGARTQEHRGQVAL